MDLGKHPFGNVMGKAKMLVISIFSVLRDHVGRSQVFCFTSVGLSVFLSVCPKLNLKNLTFPCYSYINLLTSLIFGMKAHLLIHIILLVPRSRSSAKVKVKYQGLFFQKTAILGALVFLKLIHLVFSLLFLDNFKILLAGKEIQCQSTGI